MKLFYPIFINCVTYITDPKFGLHVSFGDVWECPVFGGMQEVIIIYGPHDRITPSIPYAMAELFCHGKAYVKEVRPGLFYLTNFPFSAQDKQLSTNQQIKNYELQFTEDF